MKVEKKYLKVFAYVLNSWDTEYNLFWRKIRSTVQMCRETNKACHLRKTINVDKQFAFDTFLAAFIQSNILRSLYNKP